MVETNYGDTPGLVRGAERDYKRLFFSRPEIALIIGVSLRAGYGVLKAGTILTLNGSGTNDYKYLPYCTTTFSGKENPGRAMLVSTTGAADNFVYVTLADSYKFRVTDDLIIADDTTPAEDLGAITEIDRTTWTHMAKITATTNIGGAAFTVARLANVYVQAAAATPWSAAVGILGSSVGCGVGSKARGANANMIVGNAALYKGLLHEYDADALADFTARRNLVSILSLMDKEVRRYATRCF